jgi:hypothetical protein
MTGGWRGEAKPLPMILNNRQKTTHSLDNFRLSSLELEH